MKQRSIVIQVSSINKQFAFICDVITKIPNRELLYDLIPYLTNVRVILSACSRYLQWVGLRDCRKPLRCGPTLAGLYLFLWTRELLQKKIQVCQIEKLDRIATKEKN